MEAIESHPNLELFTLALGTHALPRFGSTVDEIRKDGLPVHEVVLNIIEGETPTAMCRSIGLGLLDLATILDNHKPDIVLLCGDRFEILSAAIATVTMNIHLAHLQGGEVSGTIDESFRHAITKLAHIHFPSNELAKEFIIRMGESPESTVNVGCPSVDLLKALPKLTREEACKNVEAIFSTTERINPAKPLLMVAQHPVTTEFEQAERDISALLDALYEVGHQAVFLWPNVDAGASKIVSSIRRRIYEKNTLPLIMVRNIPFKDYMTLLAHADCLIGNSSSGIREACYFGTPVVNIGSRQNGRIRGKNVLDINISDTKKIADAISRQLAHGRYPVEELYGSGGTGRKIADILSKMELPPIQKSLGYLLNA